MYSRLTFLSSTHLFFCCHCNNSNQSMTLMKLLFAPLQVFSSLDTVLSLLQRDYVINAGKNLTIPCGDINSQTVWTRDGGNITNNYNIIIVSGVLETAKLCFVGSTIKNSLPPGRHLPNDPRRYPRRRRPLHLFNSSQFFRFGVISRPRSSDSESSDDAR